jgi:hypothetical protein
MTNTLCSNDIEKRMMMFHELLHHQYAIYVKMSTLYENEKQYICEGAVQKLQESLIEKDAFLNDIIAIENQLTPLKKEWHQCKNTVSKEIQLTVQALIDRFKILIEKIVHEQKENEALLIESKRKEEDELARLRKSKEMGKAYSVYGQTEPRSRYMDKKR